MIRTAILLAAATPLRAQERGAVQLRALVAGLTVTPRVLIIGSGPGDVDADLVAWLARGRSVQTGYLSLTRGESAPNYTGVETGASLGAIHTEEVLAARRIDGGEQYFTRAYDFGPARSLAEVFKQWDHTTLLGDIVTVVRSFRPHVIISRFTTDTLDHDGQRQASALLAREAFDAAQDTARFNVKQCGLPWSPFKLYEPGSGLAIDTRAYDALRGRTYADIGRESQSQLRSLGFENAPWQKSGLVQLRRVASRAEEPAQATSEASLFDGIDTTFARLQADAPPDAARQLPLFLAYADSARRLLDVEHPARIAPYLARAYELASIARKNLPSCKHPSRDIATSAGLRQRTTCIARWLDLDASIDLVQRRAATALLAAASVSVEAFADRELVANGDTAGVIVTISNDGDTDVSLNDVTISGAVPVRMTEAIRIPAHERVHVERSLFDLANAHPWWIYKREQNFYPSVATQLDGVRRPGLMMWDLTVGGIAMPEDMRRLSDVTVTMSIAGMTVTASVGDVSFRTADPMLGVRDRAVSGVPPVTFGFERALEWTQAGKPLRNQLRVAIKSYSDKPQTFTLKAVLPVGIRIDSLPSSMTLASREWRELRLPLKGSTVPGRYEVDLGGIAPGVEYATGFRTAQYSYLPPVHLYRNSAVFIQAVDVEIPLRLSVAYVRGTGDDGASALKQLGIPTVAFTDDELLRLDLNGVSTIVIGPNAFQLQRGLLSQSARFMDFVRKGGTIVVMSNPQAAMQPGVLPYPVTFAAPLAERVMMEEAPVHVLDTRARILTWPNAIHDADWADWVGERAVSIPSRVDARYAAFVEMHDPNEKPNRNAILVATVGKGRFIYTSISFPQQIANAVPGAMRIFVNLISAGLSNEGRLATEFR